MYCSFPSLWGSSLPLFEVCGLINFHGIKRNFYFLPTAFFTYIRSGWKWVLTPLTTCSIFYVLLTVHLGISLVNNQLDAQFFSVYVYFDTLRVASNHVLIIRRLNCINTSGICHSMQVTVWYAGIDGTPRSSIYTCTLDLHTGRPLTESDHTRCCISTI